MKRSLMDARWERKYAKQSEFPDNKYEDNNCWLNSKEILDHSNLRSFTMLESQINYTIYLSKKPPIFKTQEP